MRTFSISCKRMDKQECSQIFSELRDLGRRWTVRDVGQQSPSQSSVLKFLSCAAVTRPKQADLQRNRRIFAPLFPESARIECKMRTMAILADFKFARGESSMGYRNYLPQMTKTGTMAEARFLLWWSTEPCVSCFGQSCMLGSSAFDRSQDYLGCLSRSKALARHSRCARLEHNGNTD